MKNLETKILFTNNFNILKIQRSTLKISFSEHLIVFNCEKIKEDPFIVRATK